MKGLDRPLLADVAGQVGGACPPGFRTRDAERGDGRDRLAGRPDITEATRWAGRFMDRPFTILGLTS